MMGLADLFTAEDRLEITVSQLYGLIKDAARADLFRNGVKNKVPYAHILEVLDGNADALVADDDPIWHDAKTDPPKEPGMYYGRKDDSGSMWLCNYQDGKWTYTIFPDREINIIQWAEYTAFTSEDG